MKFSGLKDESMESKVGGTIFPKRDTFLAGWLRIKLKLKI